MVLWFFARDRGGDFLPLSVARVERFFRGRESLGDLADRDGFVYAAEVLVEMDNRVARSVSRVLFPKWRVDADGRVDREHHDDGLRTTIEMVFPEAGDRRDTIGAGRFYARRRVLHSFFPSPTEEARLHTAINRRAKGVII